MPRARIPRNPVYGKPPRWSQVYEQYCPEHTDGRSRHCKVFSQELRATNGDARRAIAAIGYDPDHIASSIESTTIALWEARAEITRLREGK
jgi:hypothetical protein